MYSSANNKYNGPPSPPETHSSYFGQAAPSHSAPARAMASRTPGSSFDTSFTTPAAPMETSTARFRRGSSIGYISTPGHSHREARERTGSLASKLLVIVVPPSSVAQEHGNLGHTLSMGPGHRLSQGLIMPLFPTMYGQLTAIAREFNFPSSAGVCLYYCYSEHGVTMTPRLSDDIWPAIWGLPEPSNGERRSPIAGKLEFDIDMTQARWYTAWLSSRHREPSEQHITPITAPNLPFRGDNRFSFPPPASEDDSTTEQTTQLRSAPALTRHVPRKLSLIDRFDSSASHASHTERQLSSRPSASPPTGLPLSSHVLSPITQQEEPKSARLDLNNRVKSWRASAIVTSPVTLETPSSEPSAVEIVAVEAGSATASQSSFHIEDYAFSISSVGPDDRTDVGSYYQDYLPSVHMCDRVNGSVASTESYCTSAGPTDSEFYLNFEVDHDGYDERAMTPDIAYCMFEEAPATPLTATSWGAPSPGPWSLSSEMEYSPSVDLGFRTQFSAAPSPPSTATSWGAASYDGSWSPASQMSAFSVHLGARGDFTAPPTPQTATSWGAQSPGPVSPASPFRLESPDAGHRYFEDANEFERRAAVAATWRPAEDSEQGPMLSGTSHSVTSSVSSSSKSPQLWGHSWPYRQAGVSLKTVATVVSAFTKVPKVPKLVAPPKGKKRAVTVSASTTTSSRPDVCSQYPSFVLYAPVYPFFDLYPAVAGTLPASEVSKQVPYPAIGAYPFFQLYAPVYPHFDLYPGTAAEARPVKDSGRSKQPITVVSSTANAYPSFQLYVPVYPHLDLYPGVAGKVASVKKQSSSSTRSPIVAYPFFQLYEPVYPYFDLYPPVAVADKKTTSGKAPAQLSSLSIKAPALKVIVKKAVVPATLPPAPKSPSAQPWGHSWPYRKAGPILKTVVKSVIAFKAPLRRPRTEGASSVVGYPHFNLYPPIVSAPAKKQLVSLSVGSGYPSFIIYPSVYPHNMKELYPGPALEVSSRAKAQAPKSPDPLAVFSGYPSLCIYRPVYPHNLSSIYPSIASSKAVESAPRSVPCKVDFNVCPVIQIYSLVYPHNLVTVYPSFPADTFRSTSPAKPVQVALPGSSTYPALVIYPAQYPFFDLYPAPALSRAVESPRAESSAAAISTKVVAHYPCFDLYPPVYPHFNLWPSPSVLEVQPPVRPVQAAASAPAAPTVVKHTPTPRQRKTHSGRLTHSELHAMVMMEQKLMRPALPLPAPTPAPAPAPASAQAEQQPTKPVLSIPSPSTTSVPALARKPSTSSPSSSSPVSPAPSVSPIRRTGSVRFNDGLGELPSPVARRSRLVPARSSTLPPRSSVVEPQMQLPPVPTSSSTLARSSTLPMRRPPPSHEPAPGARASLYTPETMRARGLRHNTMSVYSDKSMSPIARRMTMWENGGPATPPPASALPPTPTLKQVAKSRDSIVIQRIKAFDAQSTVPSSR